MSIFRNKKGGKKMAQLEVSHVTKSFDGRKVLEDVSIRLGEKELVALLGVSGRRKNNTF